MSSGFQQGVEFSHFLFSRHLDQGDRVVDATVGNGHDTVFLARLVGESGLVWGFDVQKTALKKTRHKLQQKNLTERVKLIHDGHEEMGSYIENEVGGVLFNLGYLPGSNKEVITTPQTTIAALKAGLRLLKNGGLIVLVVYTAHQGGAKEKNRLYDFCSQLDDSAYNVLHYHFINQKSEPPQVLGIQKRPL